MSGELAHLPRHAAMGTPKTKLRIVFLKKLMGSAALMQKEHVCINTRTRRLALVEMIYTTVPNQKLFGQNGGKTDFQCR